MENNSENPELVRYLHEQILPRYKTNHNGHGPEHIHYVVERSRLFAQGQNVDHNMVLTVAVYHDLGHEIDPKHHEILSAKMLLDDQILRKYFTNVQLNIMAQAIRDHRASSDCEPETIYGKIVSSADRTTDLNVAIARACAYAQAKHPDWDKEHLVLGIMTHMKQKFGRNGYAVTKMYFIDNAYTSFLKETSALIDDPDCFRRRILDVISPMISNSK